MRYAPGMTDVTAGSSPPQPPANSGTLIAILLFAVAIGASNLFFTLGQAPAEITSGDGDMVGHYAYLIATGRGGLFFTAPAPAWFPANVLYFHGELLRHNLGWPREGWSQMVAYLGIAAGRRLCSSFWAMKLYPIIFPGIVYCCWALFVRRFFSRQIFLLVSLLFLFCPFTYRYATLYMSGSQESALLCTSLMMLACGRGIARGRGLPLMAFFAGLGLATCLKNLLDVCLIVVLTALAVRHGQRWRKWATTLAALGLAYLPLPLLYLAHGMPWHGQFWGFDTSLWQTVAEPSRFGHYATLPAEIARIFAYAVDLPPGGVAWFDSALPLLLALAALTAFTTACRRQWNDNTAVLLASSLAVAIFAVMYVLSPIRMFYFYHIVPMTSYRYMLNLFPFAYILFAWLFEHVARFLAAAVRWRGHRPSWQAWFVFFSLLFLLRPVSTTLPRLLPRADTAAVLQHLRPEQHALLGWNYGKGNPALSLAAATTSIPSLSAEPIDQFSFSREFCRFRLAADSFSAAAARALFALPMSSAVRAGYFAGFGANYCDVENRWQHPHPFHNRPRHYNVITPEQLGPAMSAQDAHWFWLGYGYADFAMADKARVPCLTPADAARIPPAYLPAFWQGVGETYLHQQYRLSPYGPQYEFRADAGRAWEELQPWPFPEQRQWLAEGFRFAYQQLFLNDQPRAPAPLTIVSATSWRPPLD